LKHLNSNYKLLFTYVFFKLPHVYLNHKEHGAKSITVIIPKNLFYYLSCHIRFSSTFYSTQLLDLFSYELPVTPSLNSSEKRTPFTSNSILVYNFHNLMTQERFFIFCVELESKFSNFTVNSISELFPNSGWLEREVSELHGTIFTNKKDLRNLMLQYGDTSTPFRKSSPSIGVREFYYDSINDSLVQAPISVQV